MQLRACPEAHGLGHRLRGASRGWAAVSLTPTPLPLARERGPYVAGPFLSPLAPQRGISGSRFQIPEEGLAARPLGNLRFEISDSRRKARCSPHGEFQIRDFRFQKKGSLLAPWGISDSRFQIPEEGLAARPLGNLRFKISDSRGRARPKTTLSPLPRPGLRFIGLRVRLALTSAI